MKKLFVIKKKNFSKIEMKRVKGGFKTLLKVVEERAVFSLPNVSPPFSGIKTNIAGSCLEPVFYPATCVVVPTNVGEC